MNHADNLRCGKALALVLLFGAAPLGAQTDSPRVRFDPRLWPSGAITLAAGALTLGAELFKADLPHAACAPCSRTGLWAPDRWVLGRERAGVSRLSDALLVATLGGAAAALVRSRRTDAGAWPGDLAAWTQALVLNAALSDALKILVSRPRPLRYDSAAASGATADDGLSFPSAHASLAFAGAAAYASILHRRGALRARRGEVAVLGAAAALTAALRVAARRHFPTDAVGGAALGLLTGWFAPQIHPVR